jgi:hypothetical protein
MGLNEKFFSSGGDTARPFDPAATIWLDAANPDSYDGTGTSWDDISDAPKYNGTINGAGWNSDGYFDFDGVNDWIQTSYNPSGVSGFTTAMWINVDVVANPESFCGFWLNGGGRIDYMMNSEASNTSVVSGNTILFRKTDFIGNWNHVACVITDIASSYNPAINDYHADTITVKIYYNGVYINTVSPLPYQTPILTGMRFGRSGFGYYYDGQMSKAVVYDSALTAGEIASLAAEPR